MKGSAVQHLKSSGVGNNSCIVEDEIDGMNKKMRGEKMGETAP